MLKKILLGLLVVLLVIQLFRPEKNVSAGPQPHALSSRYTVPDSVANILAVACNDCHSNNTRYPWYHRIQPVAWWLSHHVQEGKEHLNLDAFLTYDTKKQLHKLDEVVEMVEEKEMPLKSYTWTHADARLTPEQRALIINWAKRMKGLIETESATARR